MYEEEVLLNAFGMEVHETDKYIDWNQTKKKKIKLANELRESYDAIYVHGLADAMETLLSAAYDYGYEEGRDVEASLHQTEDW